MRKEYEWLPHITDIPLEAKKNRTSLYSIALEGWRRGLKLRFHRIKKSEEIKFFYSLSNEKRKHYFNESCGDAVTEEAYQICDDKYLTYEYLQKENVPIPQSKIFIEQESIEEITKQIKHLKYPLVIKPTDGSAGKGVITNIGTENQLIESINEVREKISENIIVQEHVQGDEVRVYVLDNQVIAAAKRVPANVVGDGISTIMDLIIKKNELRKHVPHLYYRPINVNKALHERLNALGYTIDTVLEKNETVYLQTISNVSAGGEPVDVTADLTSEQQEIAIRATKAIPGLVHSGVDMIIDDENGTGKILELNTRPGIGSHLFPIVGKAIDVPSAIIDYYFPETKSQSNYTLESLFYFDLQIIFDSLNNGYLEEIELQPYPKESYVKKQVDINTTTELTTIYKLIKRQLVRNEFSGYIKKVTENQIKLVLVNENEKKIAEIIDCIKKNKVQLAIESLKVKEYYHAVKLGFEIIDDLNQMSLLQLDSIMRDNDKSIGFIEREIKRLKKRIKLIKTSSSWKITKPIRMLKS